MNTVTLQSLLKDYYDDQAREIEARLQPVGPLEIHAAAQVIHNLWLIRMYLSAPNAENPDLQKAHTGANRNYRTALKMLREFQSDRFLRDRLDLADLPAAASARDVHRYIKEKPAPMRASRPAPEPRDMAAALTNLFNMETEALRSGLFAAGKSERTHSPAEMLKRTHQPGRNEPCHCGSGRKFKFCCLQKAA